MRGVKPWQLYDFWTSTPRIFQPAYGWSPHIFKLPRLKNTASLVYWSIEKGKSGIWRGIRIGASTKNWKISDFCIHTLLRIPMCLAYFWLTVYVVWTDLLWFVNAAHCNSLSRQWFQLAKRIIKKWLNIPLSENVVSKGTSLSDILVKLPCVLPHCHNGS